MPFVTYDTVGRTPPSGRLVACTFGMLLGPVGTAVTCTLGYGLGGRHTVSSRAAGFHLQVRHHSDSAQSPHQRGREPQGSIVSKSWKPKTGVTFLALALKNGEKRGEDGGNCILDSMFACCCLLLDPHVTLCRQCRPAQRPLLCRRSSRQYSRQSVSPCWVHHWNPCLEWM